MVTPSKILVPVDFSGSSHAALEYAAVLGAQLGADVDVLHVWQRSHEGESREELLADFKRSEAGKRMMEWLAACELRGDVATHGCLTPGAHRDVPDAIIDVVTSREYDLIVMAAHTRHGLSRFKGSGVAEKVMRRAPCPVVAVPTDDDGDPPAEEAEPADSVILGPWLRPS